MLAYYPLDETTGTTVKDCSGHDHEGTVSGPTAGIWSTGKFGGGFVVGGAACIDLGAPAELLREGADFTVAIWAKADAFPSSVAFYVLGRTREPNNAGWRLGADANDAWGTKFSDGTNGPTLLKSDGAQAIGVWTHLAVTYAKSAGTVTLYVGGAPAGTAALTTITPDEQATIRIGCRGDGAANFSGTLDEARFYGRALTGAEVSALAQKTP